MALHTQKGNTEKYKIIHSIPTMNNKQEQAGEMLVQAHSLRGPEIFDFQNSLKNADLPGKASSNILD